METTLFKKEDFEVIIVKKSQYIIKFENRSDKIINSLIKTRIISGSSTDESYKIIKFKAETVKSLKDFQESRIIKNGKPGLLIPDVGKMIYSLTTQLLYLLEKESSTIIGYNPENIIVIDDSKFVFLGTEFVSKVDENTNNTILSWPYNKGDFFVSPELLKIKEIPSYIHFKTSYFSLGCLIVYAILGNNEFYKDYLKHNNPLKILNTLDNHPIKDTRFYWLLSRCLIEEAKNRSIIYL